MPPSPPFQPVQLSVDIKNYNHYVQMVGKTFCEQNIYDSSMYLYKAQIGFAYK